MTARAFLGAGDIFINRMVDGVPQGLVGPIKADSFSITPSVNTVQATSKGRYDYGQVLESVNVAQPTEFSMALKEVTGDILVMAFLGTSAAVTEVSGTLTDYEMAGLKVGTWNATGQRNLEELIEVTDGATTTYVEGTDYRLNRPMGWIMVIAGSALATRMAASAPNNTLEITGAYAGATGTNIKGSTRTEVRAQIVFDGINQADGTQCTVTVHEAVLSADSEFDFLADDFGLVNLTGNLKTPTNKDAPYEVLVQDAVA